MKRACAGISVADLKAAGLEVATAVSSDAKCVYKSPRGDDVVVVSVEEHVSVDAAKVGFQTVRRRATNNDRQRCTSVAVGDQAALCEIRSVVHTEVVVRVAATVFTLESLAAIDVDRALRVASGIAQHISTVRR
jgi:hypothetical protein